jgi:hypothetical protein
MASFPVYLTLINNQIHTYSTKSALVSGRAYGSGMSAGFKDNWVRGLIRFGALPSHARNSTLMASYSLPTPNATWPLHLEIGPVKSFCDTALSARLILVTCLGFPGFSVALCPVITANDSPDGSNHIEQRIARPVAGTTVYDSLRQVR